MRLGYLKNSLEPVHSNNLHNPSKSVAQRNYFHTFTKEQFLKHYSQCTTQPKDDCYLKNSPASIREHAHTNSQQQL